MTDVFVRYSLPQCSSKNRTCRRSGTASGLGYFCDLPPVDFVDKLGGRICRVLPEDIGQDPGSVPRAYQCLDEACVARLSRAVAAEDDGESIRGERKRLILGESVDTLELSLIHI